MADLAGRVWELLESYLADERVELDDVEVSGGDRGRRLRVVVDGEDGVGVDRVAELSRRIGRLLDDADLVPGSYVLEISSPGLERKLRRPAHYVKSVGRDVKVKTRVEIDGTRSHRGVLSSVEDDRFVIAVDGVPRTIRFDEVTGAQTVFTWEKAGKPGR